VEEYLGRRKPFLQRPVFARGRTACIRLPRAQHLWPPKFPATMWKTISARESHWTTDLFCPPKSRAQSSFAQYAMRAWCVKRILSPPDILFTFMIFTEKVVVDVAATKQVCSQICLRRRHGEKG
jgi:hypothetical protein